MQTKKRAKPVKFGKKEKKQTPKPSTETEKEDLKEKDKAESEPVEEKNEEIEESGKGTEANFSSSVETLDIEITEENEPPVEEAASEETTESESQTETVEDKDEDEDLEEEAVSVSDKESPEENKKESDVDDASDFFSTPPEQRTHKKSMLPYFLKVLIVTFLLGLTFFAGIYYTISSKAIKLPNISLQKTEPTKVPPAAAPTETPVDLAEFSIKVLNGTSTSGLAAKLKTDLEGAGFKVSATGNADEDNYANTEIAAKKTVSKAFLDKLKETLKKTYTLGSTSTLATGEADVEITIGSASAK